MSSTGRVRLNMQTSTAKDAIDKLRFFVRSRYGNARQAFNKFDPGHTRQVNVNDMRKVLEKECDMVLSDVEYTAFCKDVGATSHNAYLDFDSFLKIFDVSDDITAHSWLTSTHKYVRNKAPV